MESRYFITEDGKVLRVWDDDSSPSGMRGTWIEIARPSGIVFEESLAGASEIGEAEARALESRLFYDWQRLSKCQ